MSKSNGASGKGVLSHLRHLARRTDLRLAMGFSLVFALSAAILYTVTFLTLLGALNQAQARQLEARLLGLYAQYSTGGVRRLVDEINNRVLLDEDPFFVRIADNDNTTEFFVYPPMWEDFSIAEQLEEAPPNRGELVTLRAANKDYVLEVATIRLSDQYLLQVGVGTESRDSLLTLVRNYFVLILGALVLVSFGAGIFLAGRALSPITRLHRTVRSIVETGDLSGRIPTRGGNDDIDQLVLLVNRMLENIQRLVGGMETTLDTVAHDLRTPMTRLRGVAELALRNPSASEGEYRRALETCVDESERILTLLNTLMDISEVQSGMLNLAVESIDLDALLADVCELFGFSAEDKGVTIRFVAGTGGAHVHGDAVRLRQAFGNLVDNAVKFSPAGEEVVVTSRVDDDLIVEITDKGPGIGTEELSRVWERLFRGSASVTSPEAGGLGLGLSLVKAVIDAHGGRVLLENHPAGGARAVVSLARA